MSTTPSTPTTTTTPDPPKPLKTMSQQEKLAWKAAHQSPTSATTGSASRAETPPPQLNASGKGDDSLSPCSQACTSGTVTPTEEGVRRGDREVVHAPPGGLDLSAVGKGRGQGS
ncbi:hypothetical protein ACLMJK_006413 [Lecanora helva]